MRMLSAKALKMVYDWAEQNEACHPFARAYMSICCVSLLGMEPAERADMYDEIVYVYARGQNINSQIKAGRRMDVLLGKAFELRDTLGRIIYDGIKKDRI